MPESTDKTTGLFQELKRRKVVQFVVGYLVIAWLVVQVADVLLPAFGAPDWAIQATITILIVLFPPAVILSWLFDVSKISLERTEDSNLSERLRSGRARIVLCLTTVVATIAAVAWVWQGYHGERGRWYQTPSEGRPAVVAVAPIRNLTGDPELDWLGDGLANLVRDRLAESRYLIMVSRPRWNSIVRDAANASEELALAAATDIDYIVSGEILRSPNGLILTTRATAAETGTDLAAEVAEGLTPEGVLGAVYRLSIMARQALGIPLAELVDSFAADFAVSNFAAYRAYVSGLQFFLNFDYEDAEQSMRAALELSPEFYIASYRLAMLYWVTGERDKAAESLEQIPEDAMLSPRERGYIDAAKVFVGDNDASRAIELYLQLLDQFPYEVEARQFLAEAYFHDYQEEAAIAQLRLLGEQEPENQSVWSAMGAYLTIIGKYEEAETALQRYRELAPDVPNVYNLFGDLYRQMGEFERAIQNFETALALDPDFTLSRVGLAETSAALGNFAAAKDGWNAVIDDEDAEAEDRITAAFDLAWILRAERRFVESTRTLERVSEEIVAEKIRESMALALRSENAMQMGRHDEARRLIDLAVERSIRVPTRFLFFRAQLEIAESRFDDALATAAEIRTYALPAEDPDRTEDKAATFIEGLVALHSDAANTAVDKIRAAIALEGYQYSIYRRRLAEALRASGDTDAAIEAAAAAKSERDAGDLRLDLELERALAHQLEIELANELGDETVLRSLQTDYANRWGPPGNR